MKCSGFDWDRGNRAKCRKHGVSIETIEGLFSKPLAILPDHEHSQNERRFKAIGRTDKKRTVFIVFTLRQNGDDMLIRPISARYMHEQEVENYEKENPHIQE